MHFEIGIDWIDLSGVDRDGVGVNVHSWGVAIS